jgi:hypothetical protein
MPCKITWEPEGVHRRYSGNVRGGEVLKAIQTICADPRFDALRFDLADFLDVQGFDVSPSEDDQIVAQYRGAAYTNSHFVVAIVTNDERIRSAILTAHVALATPLQIGLFATVADARAWIGSHPLLAGRLDAHM